IATGASYTPNMAISTQPMDRKDMLRLKDTGLACIEFNLEVWGAELFEEVCPGKARHRGLEHYKEAYLEAIDIFGVGNVACNFVAGVSLMPENGHKTWQEARDSLIEGFRWLIQNGVLPTFLSLRLGVGSIYGDDTANQSFSRRMPPADYYLDAALGHHQAMLEYGLYDTLNKLMFCPLDCLPPIYSGDIGILELAGNPGNWAADCVPADANWLAKFIASVNAPVR
ncbi:MAG: hypothetical protein Q7O66_11115, partial [Dehalococcoidia bacterium]|nr:hypothetical protein [Dehalococcoidia bacterium]